MVKEKDGSLTVYPEVLKVKVVLADKIKKAVLDLYEKQKELQ